MKLSIWWTCLFPKVTCYLLLQISSYNFDIIVDKGNLIQERINCLQFFEGTGCSILKKSERNIESWNGTYLTPYCQSTVWKLQKFTLTEKKISSNQLFSNFLSINPLLSRNFCQKSVRVNFRNFHVVILCSSSGKIEI